MLVTVFRCHEIKGPHFVNDLLCCISMHPGEFVIDVFKWPIRFNIQVYTRVGLIRQISEHHFPFAAGLFCHFFVGYVVETDHERLHCRAIYQVTYRALDISPIAVDVFQTDNERQCVSRFADDSRPTGTAYSRQSSVIRMDELMHVK